MSRFLHLCLVTCAVALALACGSGSDQEASSIGGAIDQEVVSSESGYEVWASDADGNFIKKGELTEGTDGNDMTYQVNGLLKGTEYTVGVYKIVNGYEKVEMLSTVVVASDSTGLVSEPEGSSKARNKTKRYKRQMNLVTTYVSQKLRTRRAAAKASGQSAVSVTLSTVITEVFNTDGTAEVSLDNIEGEGGEVSITTASGTKVTASSLAKVPTLLIAAVETLKVVASTVATYTSTTVVKAADLQVLTSIITVVSNSVTVEALTTGITTIATTTTTTVTIDVTKITEEIVAAVDKEVEVYENEVASITVTDFDVVDGYGTKTGNNFAITTLNPVFVVTLSAALPANTTLASVATVAFTKGDTTGVATDKIMEVANGTKVYLMVKESASDLEAGAAGWLQPGTEYGYSVTGKTGAAVTVSSKSGTITTSDITVTMAYSSSESQVDLGVGSYTGVTGTKPTLYVHLADPIKAPSDVAPDYGIVGTNGLTFTVGGTGKVLDSGDVTVALSDDETNASVSYAKITVADSSILSASTSYTVVVNGDLTKVGSTTAAAITP
ncbi:MAG: hypothetical protein HQL32_03275, partial [Planctomycetes bacterium]|nr:hypothetical protein [Planctomycetota bacterium]